MSRYNNPKLSQILRHLYWKQSGAILKGKDREVNKKGKYKQEKKGTICKMKQVITQTNTQTVYIVPKSTMFLQCNRTWRPHEAKT